MNKSVVVVSCFGRGHWMASELSDLGNKVTLVDLSSSLGRWTPEDYEGPFGFFHHDAIDPSQVSRLNEEDYNDPVDPGFTVWLPDGPVDTLGPHSQYLLEKYNVSEKVCNYISSYSQRSDNANQMIQEELNSQEFEGSWFAHLAHKLANNIYQENSSSFVGQEPLPLFSNYVLRRVTRPGLERSFQWLEDKGIKVLRNAHLVDIQLENRKCNGIEVRGEFTGILKTDGVIWGLTGEETEVCSPKVRKALYPSGFAKASWVWERYRLRLKEGSYAQSLPAKFILIEDPYLSWSHDNLCLVQKTVSSQDFDVWVRIPEPHRFRRQYLEEIGAKLVELLGSRVPESQPEVLEWPQDFSYGYLELGPSRFPLFEGEELRRHKLVRLKNMLSDSPESWPRLDWTGQFAAQEIVLKKISQLFSKSDKDGELEEVSL